MAFARVHLRKRVRLPSFLPNLIWKTMSINDKIVETVLVSGYQHVADGGITTELVKRVHTWQTNEDSETSTSVALFLRNTLSNYGVRQTSESRLFSTSAIMFQQIVKEIKDHETFLDPAYMAPIHLEIEWPTTGIQMFVAGPYGARKEPLIANRDDFYGGVGSQTDSNSQASDDTEEAIDIDEMVADSNRVPLEDLLAEHRISIFCEYESQVWTADVYDDESEVPTRTGHAQTPRDAVEAALSVPKPQRV